MSTPTCLSSDPQIVAESHHRGEQEYASAVATLSDNPEARAVAAEYRETWDKESAWCGEPAAERMAELLEAAGVFPSRWLVLALCNNL